MRYITIIIIVIAVLVGLELYIFSKTPPVISKTTTIQNNNFEEFTNKEKKQVLFKKCNKYGTRGTLSDIFNKHNINKINCNNGDEECSKNWDIYLPCGYNNVENELKTIQISNDKQLVFGIKGCDQIVSKNGIWRLLISKYGRLHAKHFMPDTYLMQDENDLY